MMYKKISAVDTAFLLENNSEVTMLDVREKDELSICQIERALHIPVAEIPNRYKELPKNVPLIVFCHHG
ncbi:MAG: rhodanese-like domain-containing protein, partial [Verrucomicrobiota bacterium]|nr:rhodanese-like domain-containing protein [Verrucomicrobiota bacterium]